MLLQCIKLIKNRTPLKRRTTKPKINQKKQKDQNKNFKHRFAILFCFSNVSLTNPNNGPAITKRIFLVFVVTQQFFKTWPIFWGFHSYCEKLHRDNVTINFSKTWPLIFGIYFIERDRVLTAYGHFLRAYACKIFHRSWEICSPEQWTIQTILFPFQDATFGILTRFIGLVFPTRDAQREKTWTIGRELRVSHAWVVQSTFWLDFFRVCELVWNNNAPKTF